jgi:hypothetical protein
MTNSKHTAQHGCVAPRWPPLRWLRWLRCAYHANQWQRIAALRAASAGAVNARRNMPVLSTHATNLRLGAVQGFYSRFGAGSNQAAAHLGPECILISKHSTGLYFARKGEALQAALRRSPLGPTLDGVTLANVYLDYELDGTPRPCADAREYAMARAAFGIAGAGSDHCACAGALCRRIALRSC